MRIILVTCLIMLLICLGYVSCVIANDMGDAPRATWESQRYLIEGVHYLINEGDIARSKEFFQKAIFSSSFESLSSKAPEQKHNRQIVAEAYYFLGKIHYEQAMLEIKRSSTSPQESKQYTPLFTDNIARAKKYLRKADEYGLVHDRMHPALLAMLDDTFPDIEPMLLEKTLLEKNKGDTKITIETDDSELYRLDVIKIDQNADVTETEFLTDEELNLEHGARYKMKLNARGLYDAVYKTLFVLGIGIAVWRVRY